MKAKYLPGILALTILLYLAACSSTQRKASGPLSTSPPYPKYQINSAASTNSERKPSDNDGGQSYHRKIKSVSASWGQVDERDIDKICREVKGLPRQPASDRQIKKHAAEYFAVQWLISEQRFHHKLREIYQDTLSLGERSQMVVAVAQDMALLLVKNGWKISRVRMREAFNTLGRGKSWYTPAEFPTKMKQQ